MTKTVRYVTLHIGIVASDLPSLCIVTMCKTFAILALFILAACQTQGTALDAISAPASSVSARALQSQMIEAEDERRITLSVIDTLQDFGFEIIESSVESGLVSGAKKQRSGGFYGYNADVRVSVSISPLQHGASAVRVSFQKILPRHDPRLYSAEPIDDETIYRDFFDKLQQAIFLSKNET